METKTQNESNNPPNVEQESAATFSSQFKRYGFGVIAAAGMTAFYFLLKYGMIETRGDLDGAIFVNLIAAAVYFLFTTMSPTIAYRGRFWKVDPHHFSICIAMLCISAYSVNQIIPLFNTFTLWTEVMLFAILAPLLTSGFRMLFPYWLKVVMALISGVGLLFSLYFAIYLFPAFPIGFIGLIVFGLGVHVFAPAILFTKLLRDVVKVYRTKTERTAALTGITVPLVLAIGFLIKWSDVRRELHDAHAEVITNENQELPRWILLSQNLDDDYFTEALIKSGIYYSVPEKRGDFWFDVPSNNERKIMHDPLVFMANMIFGEIPLSFDDKVKILNAKYADRHSFESKLWSGKHLRTVDIINQIQIDPSYRYAYTEKTITIKNTNKRSWPRQEEALYTFHLPEGAVMSSLSLWVNGVERKSRLSTKQKATAAYNNIVGVQRRDPALAHWQEGNRITVRVFPCTKQENRVFKIGITTPLSLYGEKLVYDNFYFEGPALENALETTKVKFVNGSAEGADLPSAFDQDGIDEFTYTGSALEQYKITCPAPEIGSTPFCFNGNCYQVSEQQKGIKNANFNNVYLDINQTLSQSEFDDIWEACKGKKVHAFWKKMVVLTEQNKDLVYEHLSEQNFSLFPLHKIKTEGNILITKSSRKGPNLSDIKKTKFKKGLEEYLGSDHEALAVVSLNPLSDYLSSLNQFQVIDVHFDRIKNLNAIVGGKFPSKSKSADIVYIDNASMQIEKIQDTGAKGAPDHVLRMFNFNTLMKQIGRTFYNKEQYEEQLFPLANEAFVLSPISSMVVLETDEDYDRHGIDANKDSLGNASMNSSGSVPEPHEWALIILGALSVLYLYKKKKANQHTVA